LLKLLNRAVNKASPSRVSPVDRPVSLRFSLTGAINGSNLVICDGWGVTFLPSGL